MLLKTKRNQYTFQYENRIFTVYKYLLYDRIRVKIVCSEIICRGYT